MEVGKLKNEMLDKWIIKELRGIREDVLIRPGIGEDCAAIAFGDTACVLTTDPITGSGSHLGKLAVHVCLNDIASSGAEAAALLMTLLCPEGTSKEEIHQIMVEANAEANQLGIEIIGGHTEITSAVNRTIVSATAIGKIPVQNLITTAGAHAGDLIYMTKQIATEGTAIIASDCEAELSKVLTQDELEAAKALIHQISVVPEGRIGGRIGVSAMHDATEGGVLGAIHELCVASGKGCVLTKERFPVHDATLKIAAYYNIDPMKLIASGSMIMAVHPDRAASLESALSVAGIAFSMVGEVTEACEHWLVEGQQRMLFHSPEADELYKVIK